MGFESSRIARRRLAALASSDSRVHEALAPASFPGLFDDEFSASEAQSPIETQQSGALMSQLDQLARDIVNSPGAGGALIAAFAEQTRALTLVVEAAKRAGENPLPTTVLNIAQKALESHGTFAEHIPVHMPQL